jgi:hypothetical protein
MELTSISWHTIARRQQTMTTMTCSQRHTRLNPNWRWM